MLRRGARRRRATRRGCASQKASTRGTPRGSPRGSSPRLTRRQAFVVVVAAYERPVHLHPRGAAWIDVYGHSVGSLGTVNPDAGESFDVGEDLVLVEGRPACAGRGGGICRALRCRYRASRPARATSRSSSKTEWPRARSSVRSVTRPAISARAIALFDRFVGSAVPPGHSSLALHVVYRAPDRANAHRRRGLRPAPRPRGGRGRTEVRGPAAVLTPARAASFSRFARDHPGWYHGSADSHGRRRPCPRRTHVDRRGAVAAVALPRPEGGVMGEWARSTRPSRSTAARRVAIKMLHEEFLGDREVLTRFPPEEGQLLHEAHPSANIARACSSAPPRKTARRTW